MQRAALDLKNRAEQAELRELHAHKLRKPLLPFAAANAAGLKLDFRPEELAQPSFLGRRVLEQVPLAEIARYIDWTFFFTAWELRGRFPAILEHPEYGAAARDLYGAAQKLLARIVDERLLTANAVYGFWPAASDGNDIVLYPDETRAHERHALPHAAPAAR